MGVEIRLAVAADAPAIGEVFARAFANDPVTSWVTPDPMRRVRLLRRLNTLIAHYEGIPHGATYVAGDGTEVVGAAIWQPPGRHPVTASSIPFSLRAGRAIGRDIPRMISAGRAAAAARARNGGWYLQLLGVDPRAQNTGIGSALVREQLRIIDDQRSPATLETTVENLPFYRHLGFEPVGEIVIGRGAPLEYSLLRPES
ncbi:MAG TPA: GNAT family N-acetyltransferase [Galbitalea sp.]|jgi:ribosomal protein S18 acetylase RimI-like enzyme|nr:GNAT family N-acetyltransferase [Galbitalea sp.]